MKLTKSLRSLSVALALGAGLAFLPSFSFAEDAATPVSGSDLTVTGEIIDLVCYTDHGAMGEKHADCARKCIASGLPVGIKAEDGSVYILSGEHKPANAELTEHAAKTITIKGKFVTRDGIKLLENIEIVK